MRQLNNEKMFYGIVSVVFFLITSFFWVEKFVLYEEIEDGEIKRIASHDYVGISEYLFDNVRASIRARNIATECCIEVQDAINSGIKFQNIKIGSASGMLIEGDIPDIDTQIRLLDWKVIAGSVFLFLWIVPVVRKPVYLFFGAVVQGFVVLNFLGLIVCQY